MNLTTVPDINKHIDTLIDAMESVRTIVSRAEYNKLEYRALDECFELLHAVTGSLIEERDRKEPRP